MTKRDKRALRGWVEEQSEHFGYPTTKKLYAFALQVWERAVKRTAKNRGKTK